VMSNAKMSKEVFLPFTYYSLRITPHNFLSARSVISAVNSYKLSIFPKIKSILLEVLYKRASGY